MSGAWRWIAAAGLVLAIGCAKSTGGAGSVPEDFEMSLGEGGGITGLWQGHTVTADGRVSTWNGRSEKAEREPAGSVDPATCATLWTALREADFFELDSHESGNMTRVMEVTANGQTHAVRWALGDEQASALETLYGACRDALTAAHEHEG